jgi:hypothetical protein
MTLLHCLIPCHVEDAQRSRSIYEVNADVQDAGEWTDLDETSAQDKVLVPNVPNKDDEYYYLPMPPHIKMQLANMNPFL